MEEVDEIRSRPSSGDSLSPGTPIGIKTTAKSPPSPPYPRNGLELVVSPPTQAVTSGGSHRRSVGGGGRDDCWSEEATGILIDAWGERYLELKRGNLKQQHWKEVAEIVNTSTGSSKSPKTDIQCKNRIDTVKKKFKQEKAKIAAGNDNGKWIFFKKLENLIGGATTTTASKALVVTPLSSRSSLYQRKAKSTALLQQKQQASMKRSGESTRWHFRKRIASETESESEPDLSVDSADDSLPPPPLKLDKTGDGGRRELGEVATAVIGFVESYEKAETAKLKQLVELEKERMKFAKELELQRIQFFKSQLEMLRNIQEDGDSERIIMSHGSVKDNGLEKDLNIMLSV